MKTSTLYDKVYESFLKDLRSGEVQPDRSGTLPNQQQLAERYNVSLTTIKKVVRSLDEQGLVKSYRGRGLVLNAKPFDQAHGDNDPGRMLHFCVPYFNFMENVSNSPVREILNGVQEFCRECNVTVHLVAFPVHEIELSEFDFINGFSSMKIDGLLLVVHLTTRSLAQVMKMGIPFVSHHFVLDDSAVCYGFDSVDLRFKLTEMLIGLGKRHIAMFTGVNGLAEYIDRAGYELALQQHGLEFDPDYILGANYNMDKAVQLVEQLMSGGKQVDAIMAFDDIMAAHLSDFLKTSGREDILVVGGGNMAGFEDKVKITFDTKSRQIGYDMAKMLYEMINGKIPERTKFFYKSTIIDRTKPAAG